MKPNIENYLEYLFSECDRIIGDIDSFGVKYGLYENSDTSLYDKSLCEKFEVEEASCNILKEYKAVILSETGNGDFEYTMFKTLEEATTEFDSIEQDLLSYYDGVSDDGSNLDMENFDE